jgi:hypothetical protein
VDHIDVDALVADLQASINARRLAGDYPPGLEEQLEAEFDQIMRSVRRDEIDTTELATLIERVGVATQQVTTQTDHGSRVPGGAAVHSAASRLIRRHTTKLSDSVRSLGSEITEALHEVHRLFDEQRQADERQLNEVISSLIDRLAVLDHLVDAVVDLERRMAALEPTGE